MLFFFNKESTIISLNSIIHEKEDCNDQATISTKKVFLASLKSYEVCNVSAIYEEFTFAFLYDSISP